MAREVKFNLLKNPNNPKEALVLLRFNFKSRRFQISTGLSVPVKFWNPAAQRVRETQAFPFYASINARLDSLAETTLKLFFEEYAAKGIVPTVNRFKEDWQALTTQTEEEAPLKDELTAFVREVIDERGKVKKVAESTLVVYHNCLHHLKGFQEATGKPLTFDGLNKVFLANFAAHLHAQNLSDDYARKIVANLRLFVRLAIDEGRTGNSAFLKLANPFKSRNKSAFYLTEKELEKLFSLELESRLANVRDAFLLGCLTGQRFSDFTQIRPENIQPLEDEDGTFEGIKLTQKKTAQPVVIPLVHPMLREILERHGWKAPRAISGQKFNEYLRELGELAGFTRKVEVIEYKAGQQVKTVQPFFKVMASHMARRTFATNAYKAGIHPLSIIKLTGHRNVKTFMAYLAASGEETALELAKHRFFTGKGKLKAIK